MESCDHLRVEICTGKWISWLYKSPKFDNSQSPKGRGRAWIRLALSDGFLAETIDVHPFSHSLYFLELFFI
jgi:hypothetical protein